MFWRRWANDLVILRKRVAGLTEASLARFVTRAGRVAGVRGAVNVLVTGSPELRSLNRRFRKQDNPTGRKVSKGSELVADIAARNAKLLGHSPAQEVEILALHGLLHLAGYDHETDEGHMARLEQRLRKSLGLPAGLIERAQAKRGARPRR